MDLMKWLSSLDELLYEVMSWLIFYPVTIWRTIRHPLQMMAYADSQLKLPEEEQYAAALSPPLFLALSLIIIHGLSLALGETDALVARRQGVAGLVDSDAGAVAIRVLAFAFFPLLMALNAVRRRNVEVDRRSLKLPFYAQCYPGAVFAAGVSLGGTFGISRWAGGPAVGGLLALAAVLYYIVTLTRWFSAEFDLSLGRALAAALVGIVEGFVLLLAVGIILAF